MSFWGVLLFCCAGIAVCAALVFAVETLVAFCLKEPAVFVQPSASAVLWEQEENEASEAERGRAA